VRGDLLRCGVFSSQSLQVGELAWGSFGHEILARPIQLAAKCELYSVRTIADSFLPALVLS
jgi:hypothetical protein